MPRWCSIRTGISQATCFCSECALRCLYDIDKRTALWHRGVCSNYAQKWERWTRGKKVPEYSVTAASVSILKIRRSQGCILGQRKSWDSTGHSASAFMSNAGITVLQAVEDTNSFICITATESATQWSTTADRCTTVNENSGLALI